MRVLPNVDINGAKYLGQQTQTAIAGLTLPHAKSAITPHLTLSISCASVIPDPDGHWQSLITKGDQCLYRAEAQGRN